MLKLTKKESKALLISFFVTAAGLYITVHYSKVYIPLLSADKNIYPWTFSSVSDQESGGASELNVIEVAPALRFNFRLPQAYSHPWVAFTLEFAGFDGASEYVDWSQYKTLNLMVACDPKNVLSFTLYTFEAGFTKVGHFMTHRNSGVFFKCHEGKQRVVIELDNLTTPDWWLIQNGLHLSDQQYHLNKVVGIALHNSPQSPRQTSSDVAVYSAVLEGRDWQMITVACCVFAIIWLGVLGRGLQLRKTSKVNSAALRITDDAKKEPVFAPYQQLPRVNQAGTNKTKDAVLSYIATEYANPDLNIEMVASATAANRAKINEILKNEYGFTFSVYLNKLRLAEAARLLHDDDLSVADVADGVGYGSPSYFITLFKKEYGCTPSSYKNHKTTASS